MTIDISDLVSSEDLTLECVFLASATDDRLAALPPSLDLGPSRTRLARALTASGLVSAEAPCEAGRALAPFAPPDRMFPALRHAAVQDWGGAHDLMRALPPCGLRTLTVTLKDLGGRGWHAALDTDEGRGSPRLIKLAERLERRIRRHQGLELILTPICYALVQRLRQTVYLQALEAMLTTQAIFARRLTPRPLIAVMTLHRDGDASSAPQGLPPPARGPARPRATVAKRIRVAFYDDSHRPLTTSEYLPGGVDIDALALHLVSTLQQVGPDRVEFDPGVFPSLRDGEPCFGRPAGAPHSLPLLH